MSTTSPVRTSETFPSKTAAREALRRNLYRFHYFDHDQNSDIYVRVRCGKDGGFAADVAEVMVDYHEEEVVVYYH